MAPFNLGPLGLNPYAEEDPEELLRRRMIPALNPQPAASAIGRPRIPEIKAPQPVAPPDLEQPAAASQPKVSDIGTLGNGALGIARQPAPPPRPTAADFPANELHGWRKLLGIASIGAGSFESPALGERLREQLFVEPKIEAQNRLKEAQSEYDTQLNQPNQMAYERARTADTDSQARLRDAQAAAAGRKEEDALAQHGLMRDEQGQIVPVPEDRLPPEIRTRMANEKSLATLRESQQALAQAKRELEKAKNDPNSPQFKIAQQKLQMEQERTNATLRALGLHEAEFANKLGEQELVKPSGQTQSRGSQAQVILDVMPDLKAVVNKYRDKIGPWAGRIARAEIAIGDVPPEVAKVFTSMESFNALQPAAHGFRSAEFVKDWKTALGSLERNPDSFIEGLEGLRPTMEKIAKEGKTYHRRIVEGGGSAPTGGKALVWNPKTGKYE